MSGVITETDAFPATVADIKNGDDGSETTFSPPITNLTHRTRFLFNETSGRGVRRIRNYATSAAAKAAITGEVTTGDLSRIAGLGVYLYNSDSLGDPELAPIQYLVTGTAGGIWRAISLGYQARGIANGMPTLDAAVKVPSAQLRGQLVATYDGPGMSGATGGTTVGTGSQLLVTVAGASVAIANVQAGDKLVFSGYQAAAVPPANHYAQCLYGITKSDDTIIMVGCACAYIISPASGAPAGSIAVPLAGSYVVNASDLVTPTSTSLKVKMWQQASSGDQLGFPSPLSAISHFRNPS